jgi:hypothetical protein
MISVDGVVSGLIEDEVGAVAGADSATGVGLRGLRTTGLRIVVAVFLAMGFFTVTVFFATGFLAVVAFLAAGFLAAVVVFRAAGFLVAAAAVLAAGFLVAAAFLGVAFLAAVAVFLAAEAVFLAEVAVFLAVEAVFLAAGFAAGFLAEAIFFAAGFFTAVFLAAGFFVATFLAAGFRTAGFRVAVFLAAVLVVARIASGCARWGLSSSMVTKMLLRKSCWRSSGGAGSGHPLAASRIAQARWRSTSIAAIQVHSTQQMRLLLFTP